MPRVKIVGNMIEWNRPIRISDHIATGPCVSVAIIATTKAPIENTARTLAASKRCMIAEPAKRPTIMPPHRKVR